MEGKKHDPFFEFAPTPEELEKFKECMSTTSNLRGTILGFVISSLTVYQLKLPISRTVFLSCMGALIGNSFSRLRNTEICIKRTIKPNKDSLAYVGLKPIPSEQKSVIRTKKSRKEDQDDFFQDAKEVLPESATETIFDMESSPTMGLLDEIPATVENTNADVPKNKETKRTVTYEELRRRNRESILSTSVSQKPAGPFNESKDQPAPVGELETEPMESDIFLQPSTGKHKTKYGDVWD